MARWKTMMRYLACIALIFAQNLSAGEVKIAVASNFTAAMKEIATQFEQSSQHNTIVSYGSTGKIYTQILYGAPFEIFLSADRERPRQLESNGLASNRFTYAIGQLVLWSNNPEFPPDETTLRRGAFNKLALANPKTAPYGSAALTVLKRLRLDSVLQKKWVFGDNIAQTYQFVATSNADIGFVAMAQIALDDSGNYWEIPDDLYEPIHQDAVLLNRGQNNPAAVAFMDYLKGPAAQAVIEKFGYKTTGPEH